VSRSRGRKDSFTLTERKSANHDGDVSVIIERTDRQCRLSPGFSPSPFATRLVDGDVFFVHLP
jgi:hypothetical protein